MPKPGPWAQPAESFEVKENGNASLRHAVTERDHASAPGSVHGPLPRREAIPTIAPREDLDREPLSPLADSEIKFSGVIDENGVSGEKNVHADVGMAELQNVLLKPI